MSAIRRMLRAAAIADRISQGDVFLPNGEKLTVERFQTLDHLLA